MASTSEDLFEAIEAGDDGARGDDPRRGPGARVLPGRERRVRADAGALPLRQAARRDRAGDVSTRSTSSRPPRSATSTGSRSSSVPNHLSVTSYSGDGFTALHFAAFFGRSEAAALLIERGAEVDAFGRGWMTGTAMHSAASRLQSDVVRILLEAGANPNVRQSAGWTPLHAAAMNGDLTSVELLLASGADRHRDERRGAERHRPRDRER